MWNSEKIFTHKRKHTTAPREHIPIMTFLVSGD